MPLHRPRRNRKSAAIRDLCRETTLSAADLVYPLFVHADGVDTALESLPGQTRWSLDGLVTEARRAWDLGVRAVVLFPKIEDALKTSDGREVRNGDGLIPEALRRLRAACPDLCLITDVALDPYSSDGHDGIVAPDGRILNDETVAVLCEQALTQARAGADVIAPSDMMDGRVGAIRAALDGEGFSEVSILSYTAKYASAFYGPFRGALDSAPKAGDKRTYQMDPGNCREALRELELDEAEGADMVMVKPAGPYLDIVRDVREATNLPVAAYQVSGEYLALHAAAQSGWLDLEAAALESLVGIRRAGADLIFTYFAPAAAGWLAR
ncbi:MAG: porphobilinogen synthase [Planctomycetota bacterium]|nr:porphobilinogen synthase [Planctomycetota bacterium]